MSAFTPGPWTVGGSTGSLNQVEIEPSIGCAYGAGEEVIANARLISTAPDLLAALSKAIDALYLYRAYGWADRGGVIHAAEAAIAKATGSAK